MTHNSFKAPFDNRHKGLWSSAQHWSTEALKHCSWWSHYRSRTCQDVQVGDGAIEHSGSQVIVKTKVHNSKPSRCPTMRPEFLPRSLRGEGYDRLPDTGLGLGGLESLLEVLERVTGVEDRL